MAADGSAGSEMEWSQPATSKGTVPKPFFVIFNEAFGANEDPTSKGLGTGSADVGSISYLLNGPILNTPLEKRTQV